VSGKLRLEAALLDRAERHLADVHRAIGPLELDNERFRMAKQAALQNEANTRFAIATLREGRSLAAANFLSVALGTLADTLDLMIKELSAAKAYGPMADLIKLQPPVATTPNDVALAVSRILEAADAALDASGE
jgi:hypothetical protein